MHDAEKFAAVEDNFIHIHGALLHDLQGIVEAGSRGFQESFPRFARILEAHTLLEDKLFFPALEEREPGASQIADGAHQEIEEHLAQLVGWVDAPLAPSFPRVAEKLDCFRRELEIHLVDERRVVMPAMMENFSADELWALDGRIMEFCSPEFMQEMMPWWFIHMDLEGRVAVAGNMIAGVDPGFVPVLAGWIEEGLDPDAWHQLLDRVPGLEPSPAISGVQAGA
ncbi:MAG: hemerythrin domain-containing protein [Myxococcota bacterium]|nr:hemerythrin domain-containing protein [Myxococcota bacterium]